MTKQQKTLLFALLPFFIATLIMLPRLMSPQFGLFDDGWIYTEVQKILQGDFSMQYDNQAGRFRPLYWLYFTAIYLLAGSNPVWFFIGHWFILIILLVEMRVLLKFWQAEDWQILFTSLVFLFSIPIIENFYTLSKGDPLSLVFILISLIILEELKRLNTRTSKWIYIFLEFVSGLCAIWAKETAYIMAPISAVWAGMAFLYRKFLSKNERQAYLIYFLCMAVAMIAFFLIRAIIGTPSVTGGTFTERYSFTLDALLSNIPRWFTLYINYYLYLIPFGVMALIVLMVNRDIKPNQKFLYFSWGIWILAWVGALIPWEYARAYYLLAFSFGVSILIGLIAPEIRNLLQHSKNSLRFGMKFLTFIFFLVALASLTHYRTHAKTQLIFDRMNYEMLEITKEITPKKGFVFSNFETKKEYVEGIEYFLIDMYGLDKIHYDHVDMETMERLHWHSGGIVLMPYVSNLPKLTVRAGVDEEFTMAWNEIVIRNKGEILVLLTNVRDQYRIVNLNLPVLFCPVIGNRGFYCKNPDPFFDISIFEYGWDIYQIQ